MVATLVGGVEFPFDAAVKHFDDGCDEYLK